MATLPAKPDCETRALAHAAECDALPPGPDRERCLVEALDEFLACNDPPPGDDGGIIVVKVGTSQYPRRQRRAHTPGTTHQGSGTPDGGQETTGGPASCASTDDEVCVQVEDGCECTPRDGGELLGFHLGNEFDFSSELPAMGPGIESDFTRLGGFGLPSFSIDPSEQGEG